MDYRIILIISVLFLPLVIYAAGGYFNRFVLDNRTRAQLSEYVQLTLKKFNKDGEWKHQKQSFMDVHTNGKDIFIKVFLTKPGSEKTQNNAIERLFKIHGRVAGGVFEPISINEHHSETKHEDLELEDTDNFDSWSLGLPSFIRIMFSRTKGMIQKFRAYPLVKGFACAGSKSLFCQSTGKTVSFEDKQKSNIHHTITKDYGLPNQGDFNEKPTQGIECQINQPIDPLRGVSHTETSMVCRVREDWDHNSNNVATLENASFRNEDFDI